MIAKKTSCSIREVAQHVGLSICTVSKVLNNCENFKILESTRKRVLEVAQELNYVPNINAKRLFQRKSGILGLIVPSQTEGDNVFADHHFINIMSGMERCLADSNYSLLLKFNNKAIKDPAKYLKLLRNGSVDGLLIWGAHSSDIRYYRELAKNNVPHLFITSLPEPESNTGFNFIHSDYESSSERLTARLLERGCRKLLYLAGPEDGSVSQLMTAGINRAIQAEDVKLVTSAGRYLRENACARAMLHLKEETFDGIIASSSKVALGAADAIRELGLPESGIQLVILDSALRDEPVLWECGMALINDEEIGQAAIEGIVGLIEQKTEKIQTRIMPKLTGA